MAPVTHFKGYTGAKPPTIPKPEKPVDPMIATVQDGVPVVYPGCHGLGVRVVHPVNPKAPAKNMVLVLLYVLPHVFLEGVQHYTFFFSSRRRHTRSLCDWSSDVCSSD